MNNWKHTIVDLGEVRPNSVHKVIFNFINPIVNLESIETSCGCASYTLNSAEKVFAVKVKTGKMTSKAIMTQKKNVFITFVYRDGTSDKLTIKMTKKI
jgi:hypothetical protein